MRLMLLLLFGVLSLESSSFASSFTDRVARILDGDIVEVLHNDRAERIRLNGVDCPEKGQVYGKRAKQAASELLSKKEG